MSPTPDRFEHDPVEAWSAGVLEAWRRVRADDVARRDRGGDGAVAVRRRRRRRAGHPGTAVRRRPGAAGAAATGVDGEAVGFARWLAANTDATRLWPAQAVANHALCGVAALDTVTAMAMLPLFDGTGWDAAVCAGAGVDPAMLPRLVPGASRGRRASTAPPVGAGTVDVFAEQLVADARAPGDVLVLCGTTLIPWVLTTGWPEVDGLWTVPYTVPGLTAVGGASNAGGLFVDAVRRLLGGPGAVDDADLDGLDPAALPVWLPYLRGERTPLHDPARRAELRGLALGHGPAAVLRAAYEASAFVVRRHVELSGVVPTRVVAAGGGTRSAPWMQALADVTGLPVEVSAVPEGAALGAAYQARVTRRPRARHERVDPLGADRTSGRAAPGVDGPLHRPLRRLPVVVGLSGGARRLSRGAGRRPASSRRRARSARRARPGG